MANYELLNLGEAHDSAVSLMIFNFTHDNTPNLMVFRNIILK